MSPPLRPVGLPALLAPMIALVLAASAPPVVRAAGSELVDLAVEEVTLDRYDFDQGDRVTIAVKVRRGGVLDPVRVRAYIDTGEVRQVASTVTLLDADADARFPWTASYDSADHTIIVGAYVEPYAGEPNLDDNGLWRVFHAPGEHDGSHHDPGLHYAVVTHHHITAEAIKLANIPEVTQHAERIIHGAVAEDSFPDLVYGVSWFFGLSTLWTRHFWDVDQGEQGRGLWGRESAVDKGRAYLFGWGQGNHPGAYALYEQGQKALAFEYLGRTLHFIEDVSTPAHVHLDAHAFDDDEAEKWGADHAQQYTHDLVGAPHDDETFYDIIHNAAQLADSLPSDDVEGDTEGFVDPGGWTPLLRRSDIVEWNALGWDKVRPAGMKALFDRTIPSAIAHAAGMIRLFWRTTHPGESLPPPATGARDPAWLSIRATDGRNPYGSAQE